MNADAIFRPYVIAIFVVVMMIALPFRIKSQSTGEKLDRLQEGLFILIALLAFFLLVHVGAVLYGRTVLNLDTNFYFAAAGFHVPPNQFFFAPYYFLAILALFTHLGCAAYWHLQTAPPRTRALAIALPMVVGGAVSLLIVLSLAGKLQPVEVPAKYKATYARRDG